MATIGLTPGTGYHDATTDMQGATLRRPLFPAVRWGAILAGVAVGISMQLVLTLLGIATGLTTTDISAGESLGSGPLIWAGLSMLIAAFIGGYVAARMSGLKRKVDGILHGAVSWAVTTLMFVVFATSAGGSLLSGVFNTMAPAAASRASTSGGGASAITSLLSGQPGGAAVDAGTLRRIQQLIQNGRRDEAISAMTSAMGMDRTRAGTIVDQALILSGSPERASPQARTAADNALKTAGGAAWGAFIAVALSLAMGLIGGAIGAITSRRITWIGDKSSTVTTATASDVKITPHRP